jgi:hypothetical protein
MYTFTVGRPHGFLGAVNEPYALLGRLLYGAELRQIYTAPLRADANKKPRCLESFPRRVFGPGSRMRLA